MPGGPFRSKRSIAVIGLLSIFIVLLFIITLRASDPATVVSATRKAGGKSVQNGAKDLKDLDVQDVVLTGHAIMPKLGNETAKAELGRAAWKLLHTTMARFPDEPTTEESAALKSYVHLFQRLYPCGECAQHFRTILDRFPPQVGSRSTAAAWACHVHNEVNKSLKKELFDCSNIGDFYDCGCADDEDETSTKPKKSKDKTDTKKTKDKPEMSAERKEMLAGEMGREFNEDVVLPKLHKEG